DLHFDLPFLAFAPDGKTLAWNQANGIQLWDLAKGKEVRQFGGQAREVTGLAFSPDGGILAASSDDGTVRFWDPATGTVRGELNAPRGGFSTLAFSPDGKTLFTGGSDTTVLLWDMARVVEQWRSHPRASSPEELEALWNRL